jgi:hypothetical protein
MTVGQLIEQLSEYPDYYPVTVTVEYEDDEDTTRTFDVGLVTTYSGPLAEIRVSQ